MIERERLEKLIDEWARIYTTNRDKVVWCALDNKMYCDDEILYLEDKDDGEILYLKDIFETPEEAEWVAKMHTQRTEYFTPPTYEEFEKDPKFSFWVNKFDVLGGLYCIEKTTDIVFDEYGNEVEKEYLDIYATLIENHKTGSGYFYRRDYTKDNYIKACEFARNLFLGKENKDD